MTRARAVGSGLLLLALSACCPAPTLRPVVQVPELPVLPTIKAEALRCLDDGTYTALVTREVLHRETLEQCQEMLRELVSD